MAEFKLGRIRFVWKNEWQSGTTYVRDDVVRKNGKVFICTVGHVADVDFYVDANNVPARWNQASDGQAWRGDWAPGEIYYVNDIVKYGGQVYICTQGHESAATFDIGLEADLDLGDSTLSKWDSFAESFDWKDEWVPSTRYKLNDIVKYGGNLYLCNVGHMAASTETQGLEGLGRTTPGVADDIAKWDIYSESFDWKTNWQPNERYKLNDVVKFGGTTYVCNQGHTSGADFTAGLEADQSKWDYFNQGFEYKGDWNNNAVNYKINDVVKYGASIWICVGKHTSDLSTTFEQDEDSGYWQVLVEGLEFENSWNDTTIYQPGDVVTYGGYAFIATTNHSNIKPTDPTVGSSNWDLFTTGFKLQNDWNPTLEYKVGDVVRLNGYTYIAIEDTPVITTTATATTGSSEIITVTSTANFEVGMAVRFSGSVFGNLQTNFTYYVEDIVSLTEFKVSQLVNGLEVNIQTATGSMSVSVTPQPPKENYWSRLNSGIRWLGQWRDDYDYVFGDAVKFGVNSYICIQAHHSEGDDGSSLQAGSLLSRPDQDVTGTFWNILANGSEESVLTTPGDLVYYAGAGPARLPIGQTGQVLVVNNIQQPSWAYWGTIDQLYYVSLEGVDEPAPSYGISLDRPWKTIKYAADQIEKGARNPNAAHLIAINRLFIQRETVEWIDYQIANNIAPFVTGFTYDQTKCERDMGFIIDALVWDLTHGGNVRSRKAALEYVTNAPAIYSLGQKEETVAAITYAVQDVILGAILSNTNPAANYQILNAVPVGDRISQVIDLSKNTEDEADEEIIFLATAIVTAINDGTTAGVPAEIKPQRTILVKTGVFYETLPIIVPVDTAVVGDELRSTNIRPATSQISSGDVPYSLDALTRIKAIVSDIVRGITVAKTTTGSNPNTEIQSQNKPFASATEGTLVENLAQNAYDYIDFYINSTGLAPAMTGSNNPSETYNVYAAIGQLELNREFIVAEVHAYISLTYPMYTYPIGACSRDVNEYIDAFKHDLAYPGNYRTLMTAKWYVNGVTGSLTENMFLVRNATGVRNCTVQGLTGTLVGPNSYGTFRPTAGAYVSLDPGWGPNDQRVWITTRSCYVQNVTTFGTACVGCKIDGSLHNGGNRSIVANDFTQILSDGIGVWCTNLGLTELVSVFSYYGHIGYLAENGGKIRATNGNSSYGTYGTVSEGVDSTEVPIVGETNNRFEQALVGLVTTNNNNILRIEYINAGSFYTSASYTFNGPGVNAEVVGNETRDDGVFEVRLLELDDSSGQFGGSDYVNVENVAQSGTLTSITLAATDSATSASYIGIRVVIISGTGMGQYGYINAYNSGTKLAQIYKESTGTPGWDHVVPGWPIIAPDASTQYSLEPRLTLSAPPFTQAAEGPIITDGNSAAGYVEAAIVARRGTYTAVASTNTTGLGAGATFNIVYSGLKYTSVTVNAVGLGYNVNDILQVEPVSGSIVTIKVTRVTSPAGAIATFEFNGIPTNAYAAWAIPNTGNQFMLSTDISSWETSTQSSVPTGVTWTCIASASLTSNDYFVVLPTGSDTALYTTGVDDWSTAVLPQTGNYTGVAFGEGRFVGVRSDSATPVVSLNGNTWANGGSNLPGSTSWSAITYGAGKFVAVATGGTAAAYSLEGSTWLGTTLPASTTWNSVVYGNGRFVAVNSDGTAAAYSLDGITWTAITLPGGFSGNKVSYGQGVFVATNSTVAGTTIWTSDYGIIWTARTVDSGKWSRAVFGNAGFNPVWAAFSTDTAGTGPTDTTILVFETGATAQVRARVTDGRITLIRVSEPGSNYTTAPTLTITDPNNIFEAPVQVRIGKGALANPSFVNRGISYATATASVTGDGFADVFQYLGFVDVKNMLAVPVAGSNIEFASLPGQFFKLVTVTRLVATGPSSTGPFSARLQVSPAINIQDALGHEVSFEARIKYSQVRLTGHDFLDIGTGNFTSTNYPGLPFIDPVPESETVESGGGRVFFTSTDQDGNFRVGDLFTIEQATGTATLNADAFNIAGLQELSLGSVELGTGGAAITEFSTDQFFTADSDAVIPTQRAIKAYISSQIGSGASTLNVNTLTAGSIFVANNVITTTTNLKIDVTTKMNFIGGVDGYPVAMNLFLHG